MPTAEEVERDLAKNRLIISALDIVYWYGYGRNREEMHQHVDRLVMQLGIPPDCISKNKFKFPGGRMGAIAQYAISNPGMETPSGSPLGQTLIDWAKESYVSRLSSPKERKIDINFEKNYEIYAGKPILEKSFQDENRSRSTVISRSVFVVHGHDEAARECVARYLEKIGFTPIILHEQANKGRTIIEKIEAHSDVGFAVVLLTPDDEGSVKGGEIESRARQNVLIELGYFIGRLGRERVCSLKKGNVAIPSDFAGVVWEPMDNNGGWRQSLARELQASGYEIDWNRAMSV